jgi:hypothetical protein
MIYAVACISALGRLFRLRQQGSSIYFFQIFALRAKIWKK